VQCCASLAILLTFFYIYTTIYNFSHHNLINHHYNMKFLTYVFAFFALGASLQAQTNGMARLLPDPYLAPFYHGVASGDPLADRVILWTRITNGDPNPTVNWRVATDTGMVNIVQQGTAMTDASKDFTIKIDATGLLSATTYYYEFEHGGITSLRGRTKTLPVGDVDSLRFAVVSCSNMGHGYFNAYNRIVARNDVDAVLHLGDYEYEYGNGEFGSVRTLTPLNEVFTLNDYRMRHADYKLDADLRSIQQQYAFISVWDDHETANDSWQGGAANHTEGTEGLFVDRRSYSTQAYFEWMPVRPPNAAAPQQIYRKFDFGDLAQLNMVDTRLEGREQQTAIGAAINTSATRTLMGTVQFDWLCNNLRSSTRKWQILGNQVMMAPIKLFGQVLNPDQWDGYPAERARLYDTIMTHNIQNFVVLTGDIHTAWGNDLPLSGYNSSTGANSAGVEFVCTSVTSTGLPFNVPQAILQSSNPHNKYVNLTEHGYSILDINKQRTQGEWYYMNTITSPSTQESFAAARYNLAGTRFLQSTTTAAIAHPTKFTTPAPPNPRFTDVATVKPENGFLDVYPNPLRGSDLTLRYYLAKAQNVFYALSDVTGKLVFTKNTAQQDGLIYDKITLPALVAGTYVLTVKTMDGRVTRKVVVE
jgi:alkaline phosphatase D